MRKICRECGIEKICVWSGRLNSSGRRIYVNQKTQWWNGRQCPDCKYNKPYVRKSEMNDLGPEHPQTKSHAKRTCRVCKGGLLVNRFVHSRCQTSSSSSLYEVYGMADYGW